LKHVSKQKQKKRGKKRKKERKMERVKGGRESGDREEKASTYESSSLICDQKISSIFEAYFLTSGSFLSTSFLERC
jgi:hypothetical protein